MDNDDGLPTVQVVNGALNVRILLLSVEVIDSALDVRRAYP